MKRHGKDLIAALERLGFDHIWTNSSGYLCYVHPADPAQTEVTINPGLTEQAARSLLARARKLAGTTAAARPETGKRNARQVKDRAAAARQRLQDSREARQRLLDTRADTDTDAVAAAEALIAQRERELAAVERLMRQPPQGGNTHRGRRQPRHHTGARP